MNNDLRKGHRGILPPRCGEQAGYSLAVQHPDIDNQFIAALALGRQDVTEPSLVA